ncbi:MAG: HAMP domain-containing protein [Lachnospiraceae bacterium]|nr:HAMP domain-containing protein [Lachnospiraceae bacterium]
MVIILKTINGKIADAFSTVRWKTIIIYFSIFIFVFGFIAVTVGNIVSDFLTSERTTQQGEINQQFAINVTPHVISNNSISLYEKCLEAGNQYYGRFLIADTNKIVIADSFSELNGTLLTGKEVDDIVTKGVDKSHAFYKSKSGDSTIHSVNYACGIYENGNLVGVCLYVCSFQDIHEKIMEIYISIWTIAIIASIAVFVLCLASSHYITKPLSEFSTAIHNMSNGNFDTHIEIHGKSELDNLGRTFNMMSKKLANLDRLRNEFVSNASHELRTPLSSIKILIQSMMYDTEMSKETRTEFLKDIDDEIDRLNNIIEDLLNLVQTNTTKNPLRLSPTNIEELLRTTIEKLQPIAEKKNITLNLNAKDDVTINCDKIKLQICFSNLIDNAIKYGNENGHVDVTCLKEPGNLVVTVKDDGIGIPAHDLPNIFDRFYRVDKTRSRSTGGTGLGLSITQRVIHLHGGTISTTSKLGEGTEFTIMIPIID